MAGSILEKARRDAARFTQSGGFEVDITLTAPDGLTSVDITGLHTRHHQAFDSDGMPANILNMHVGISEKKLTELGYPVRNAADQVDLYQHRVQCADATGTIRKYVVNEQYPDEGLGHIVLILGSAED
jgi:hypothetical protein